MGLAVGDYRNNGRLADAYTNIGLTEIVWEKYASARAAILKALSLDPNSARALYYEGLLQRRAGNTETEIADFRKVVEMFPQSRDARRELGITYYQQNDNLAALEQFEALQKIDPDDLTADATLDGKRKEFMDLLTAVPLLIIDDLGMRKLPLTAAEELLEIIMRRYERASTLLTSNRPVDDWGKLLGDSAAVTAMLGRLLHHGHLLKCGPRSWRTKTGGPGEGQ
jgi:tetratricopeptide (TPR) repeat protein